MKKALHFLPIVIAAIVLSLIFVIQGSGGQNDAIEHQTTRQQEMERYMYTYELDNEAFQKEVYTPDSILNGNTGELLDWFFDSSFLFSDVCLRSVAYVGVADMEKADDPLREVLMPAGPLAPDYRRHPAFAELLTRDDALDALESKAIQANKDEIPFGIAKIKAIYGQLLLRNKSIDRESIEIRYPVLWQMTSVSYSAYGDFAFVLGNVVYYYGGTVYSANNQPSQTYYPGRDLTSYEISNINSQILSDFGLSPLSSPSSRYNCHSYAWYQSSANSYWIINIDPFRSDSACTAVPVSSVQEKDIIVYCDDNGNPLHSGMVIDTSGDNITVKSKWGQAGVYSHAYDNVPDTYRDQSSGNLNVLFYRYH